MRLKLVESAQLINKLEYNIENIVLPVFKEYGFRFNTMPTVINPYVYTYKGVAEEQKSFVVLRLSSSASEIDLWNVENSDEYVGDLFATLQVGLNQIELGVISSKDPNSVKSALDNADIKKEIDASVPDKLPTGKDAKLIYPKSDSSEYGPMTKEDWVKELQRLIGEVEKAQKAVEKDIPDTTRKGSAMWEDPDSDYAGDAQVAYWKAKQEDPNFKDPPSVIAAKEARDKYKHFISSVYPL